MGNQTKKLLHSKKKKKETINKTKRPPTEWETMFVNNISGNKLISKIYKELIQLIIKNEQLM